MRRKAVPRQTNRALGCGLLLLAALMVVGLFYWLYSIMTPPDKGASGILVSGTPFPTPQALGDFPLGLYLQQRAADLSSPAGSDPTPIAFTVSSGELPADVAARLVSQGFIRDADLFVKLVKYLHVGSKIQAGEFVLRQTMTMNEIIDALQHGRAKTITVTIRPGWRAEEVSEYLSTLGLTMFSRDQFLQAVRAGDYDYGFLSDRPKGAGKSLEGYLFPETYDVTFDTSLETLLRIVLNTFDRRVSQEMRHQAAASKMTLHEVITLASIVEREAAVPSERATIASVYLNRLKKSQLLQADPTVQYALGFQTLNSRWWKSPISLDEYQNVKSPYNTYLNSGLPPGPICSPSLASIIAVLRPAQTDYYYFLGKGDGSHVFARTFEEHQENLTRYGYK